MIDVSPAKEIEFIQNQQKCEAIWGKMNANIKIFKVEQKILENCSETKESIYEVLGSECSWYCAGGTDSIIASSYLKPFKGIDYKPKNIHDLSYKTAWIEGVSGTGVGEFVVYHFPPQSPRITEVIVVNGYVKSEQAWKDNSRVKTLKMYVNDKPIALLKLADSRQEQHFTFEPIGNANRSNFDLLKQMPSWTIKFEIVEVYKGDKYDDTAISEIYFDGIDVH